MNGFRSFSSTLCHVHDTTGTLLMSDRKRNKRSKNASKFWKESQDVDMDNTDDAESPGRCDATDGPCESHVHIVKAENAFPVFFYIITVKNQTT